MWVTDPKTLKQHWVLSSREMAELIVNGRETETMNTTPECPQEEQHVLGYLTVNEKGDPTAFHQCKYQDMTHDTAQFASPFWFSLKDRSTPSECGGHCPYEETGVLLPEMQELINQLNDRAALLMNPLPIKPSSPAALASLPYELVSKFCTSMHRHLTMHEQGVLHVTWLQSYYSSLTETQKQKLVEFISSFSSEESTPTT